MSIRNQSAYQKFERLLQANGVTASEVAQKTGISKSTFSAWKQDRYTLKVSTLEKIADYFKVSVTYFIE